MPPYIYRRRMPSKDANPARVRRENRLVFGQFGLSGLSGSCRHMLRSEPESDHPGGKPAEEWKQRQQPDRKRR
jgi:hypothetical protein